MKLDEFPTNSNYQFWTLQIVGWTGWVVLFTIRDFYWGQPLERVTLLGVQAIAGNRVAIYLPGRLGASHHNSSDGYHWCFLSYGGYLAAR